MVMVRRGDSDCASNRLLLFFLLILSKNRFTRRQHHILSPDVVSPDLILGHFAPVFHNPRYVPDANNTNDHSGLVGTALRRVGRNGVRRHLQGVSQKQVALRHKNLRQISCSKGLQLGGAAPRRMRWTGYLHDSDFVLVSRLFSKCLMRSNFNL